MAAQGTERAVLEQDATQQAADRPVRTPVIDADVHEMLRSIADLLPYLDEPWHTRLAPPAHSSSEEDPDAWRYPTLPYAEPSIGKGVMAESKMADGTPAGSSYDVMKDQLLDAYDIEVAILTGLFYPTELKVQPEFATALARAYNDWVVEHWLAKDPRFRGSVCVAAQDPQAAAEEIDRVGSNPQVIQVMLPPIGHDVLGRKYYRPVFEAAVRNDLAIAFHQGTATQTAVGHPPYYVEWHTTLFQAWQSQLTGLIAHGVFDELPDLRVLLVESGWTWVPSFMWRFDHNYRGLRREIPWVKRMPSDIIRENVRAVTQPMEFPANPDDLYRTHEMIGSDKFLLFSTDYPHWDFDSPSRVFPSSFPADLRQRILFENAKEFYALDV